MKNARRSPWALLYKFHRYTGLIIAVIVVLLSVTGIMLNHTEELKLDERFVESPVILDWYGIEALNPENAFSIDGQWILQTGHQVFLNTDPVLTIKEPLIGAAVNSDFIVAAFPAVLVMISHEGEIIEQIHKSPIENIASGKNERIYIKNRGQVFFSDDGLLSWEISDQKNITWAEPDPLPEDLRQNLKRQARHRILPYERVALDLHSGRFFGRFGVYVIDFTGLLLILLTISGCWIWLRHKIIRLKRRKH